VESGRLQDESAASLCRRLARESRTGCLSLIGGAGPDLKEILVYLREGQLHSARSTTRGAELGDRLVSRGELTSEQLEAVPRVADEAELARVLVREGLVARDVVREVLREQALDALSLSLAWTEGTWRFADGETVREENPLGMSVQDALMEGARRMGQHAILAHLGPMDTVVDFPSTGGSARLSLKPDEWALLTSIDGRSSVAEIAERSGCGELETARIIFGLLSVGVVRKVAPTAGGPPSELLAELDALGQRDPSTPSPDG
jgi:hypothetical protein